MNSLDILTQNAKTHSRNEQLTVAAEECAELIQAIAKVKRYGENDETLYHLSEEMADVEIMLEQLKIIYGNVQDVARWKKYKIERIERSLKNGTFN